MTDPVIPAGAVVVEGTFAGQGVICPRLRLDSGETVSLSGSLPEMAPGERVTLIGRWAPETRCMQGREFNVLPVR